MSTHDVVREDAQRPEARDWGSWSALLHPEVVYEMRWRVEEHSGDAIMFLPVGDEGLVTEVADHWPESYDTPPGREHLVDRW